MFTRHHWFQKQNRNRTLAFALSGGGARGMLQVGALRALLEANLQPDMWVGTSIGGMNAAFLAIHGFTPEGMTKLEAAWADAAVADLLPGSYLRLTARILLNRISGHPQQHLMRDFFIAHGATPELRFGDLPGPRLILVSADLNGYDVVLHGTDPAEFVLDGLLASTAIPPWIHPLRVNGKLLADGGFVSNLPLEPAIHCGATEIIALHIDALQRLGPEVDGFGPFFLRVMDIVEQRQFDLELALAQAKKVPVHLIPLQTKSPHPIWDVAGAKPLLLTGYNIARQEMGRWAQQTAPAPPTWIERLGRKTQHILKK
ncbi:MAG: hypothetical protein D6768_09300 [Chloroflexi bacterium]|nr:MAG: hypothetical protein D6768_09300 [Chloroflexota bacterium]